MKMNSWLILNGFLSSICVFTWGWTIRYIWNKNKNQYLLKAFTGIWVSIFLVAVTSLVVGFGGHASYNWLTMFIIQSRLMASTIFSFSFISICYYVYKHRDKIANFVLFFI